MVKQKQDRNFITLNLGSENLIDGRMNEMNVIDATVRCSGSKDTNKGKKCLLEKITEKCSIIFATEIIKQALED